MIHLRNIFLCIVTVSQLAIAQAGWTLHQNTPTDQYIFTVSYTNKNNCTIAGYGGIQRTTDGGKTWLTQYRDLSKALTAVWFADSIKGFVVGNKGTILKTTNAGKDWISIQHLYSGTDVVFNDLAFSDSLHGLIVGTGGQTTNFYSIVLQTSDGGKTWNDRKSNTTYPLESVALWDSLTGLAAGSGIILNTSDGGKSWFQKDPTVNYFSNRSVAFRNKKNAFAVGDNGAVLKTTDIGNSWTAINGISSGNLTSIAFTDSLTGTITGSNGSILRTTNGGANWNEQASGTANYLRKSSFIDSQNGFVVGNDASLLKTTDGGKTWLNQINGTANTLNAISYFDNKTAVAVGEWGAIIRTTDGGLNWTHPYSGTPQFLYDLIFVDKSFGIAVGSYSGNEILKTTDAGLTWNSIVPDSMRYNYSSHAVHFVDRNWGVIACLGAKIIKTTDGGKVWVKLNSGTSNDLVKIKFINKNVGIAVGYKTIIKTTDGGTSWKQITPEQVWFYNAALIDESKYVVIGEEGRIFYTSDGGINWMRKESLVPGQLLSICMLDKNVGYISGYNSPPILKTVDGGLTWGKLKLDGIRGFSSISAYDANNIIAVGSNGGIISTSTGSGEVSINGSDRKLIPDNYELSQNYPNPFNPVTKINYSVPHQSNIVLKIYDSIGREINTLVNGVRSAGTYSVDFDAAKLSSGIYFYSLSGDGIFLTKKMILLK